MNVIAKGNPSGHTTPISATLNVQEYIFLCAWFLYYLFSVLDHTDLALGNSAFPTLFRAVRYLSYILFLVCIYLKRLDNFQLIGALTFGAVFMMSYIGSNEQKMALFSLPILAALNIDADKIMRVYAAILGCMLIFFVILSRIGLIQDYIYDPTTRVRHCLGFTYTTYPPILFFHLALILIYLHRDKIRPWGLLILEAINVYFYIMTDTLMTFGLLSLSLIIIAFYQYKRKVSFGPAFKSLLLGSPMIMMIISLLSVKFFDPAEEFWSKLDSISHTRLSLGHAAIEKYGITLFGNEIDWIGSADTYRGAYNYVDSSYIQILVNYGLLTILCILFLYTYLMYRAIKMEDGLLVIILLTVMTLALSEPRLMNLRFNIFPMLLFADIKIRPSPGSI